MEAQRAREERQMMNKIEELRRYRRDLHQIPEAGFREFKTKEYLLSVLCQHDEWEIAEVTETGLCAFLSADAPSLPGAVAFRSDMDGLTTEEHNDVPYRSQNNGMMHACGHDGHMAMLLWLASALPAMKSVLPQNVVLVFQPAEEGPGGAEAMLSAGIVDRYDIRRMYAIHLGPSDEPGSLATRPGPFMARSSEIDITVHGKSSHCSAAHKGIDALSIGCRLLNDLYEREQTILPEEEFRLLKFGRMESGVVRNAISDRTTLEGTLRCFSEEAFSVLLAMLRSAADSLEEETGCVIEIRHTQGYPPLINDAALFEQAREALSDVCFITLRKPSMASDDFAFFSQVVPSLCLFLGTGNKTPLHSDVFDFDESVLANGVDAYIALLFGTPGLDSK
jgi:hippurate hydrolase